jgi:serine/threonine protein kinase
MSRSSEELSNTQEMRRGSRSPGDLGLRRGDAIGKFIVRDELGSGGMGIVVSALDPTLDRVVAIKVLRPEALSADARTRLAREARAMAKIRHPNVIAVHEADTVDDRMYIAMEYVEGETLRDWQDAQARPWRHVVDKYIQAARGLEAAHAEALVHRDFKPENVLVGDDGRVCVTDFGLVGEQGERAPHIGTPLYMAPEQHSGAVTDARADQFALCVALYEALFGDHPFDGNTYLELAINVTNGALRQPPADTVIPTWLRDAVMKGLALDPNDRHDSISELILGLLGPRAARRTRRRAATLGLAAIVGLALGGMAPAPAPVAHASSAAPIEPSLVYQPTIPGDRIISVNNAHTRRRSLRCRTPGSTG